MCMLGCAYGVVVAKRWLPTLAMAMVVFDAISNQIINTGLSNVERRSALRQRVTGTERFQADDVSFFNLFIYMLMKLLNLNLSLRFSINLLLFSCGIFRSFKPNPLAKKPIPFRQYTGLLCLPFCWSLGIRVCECARGKYVTFIYNKIFKIFFFNSSDRLHLFE